MKQRISALLPEFLVSELKNESEDKNITQSAIIQKALEIWFAQKMKKDLKELSKIEFKDLPSENEWHDLQSL